MRCKATNRASPPRRLSALLLALLGFAGMAGPTGSAAGAEPRRDPSFNEQVSKQAEIYRSRGIHVPEGYVIDRSLLSYFFTLPPDFAGSLADLGPQQRWLDIGAGEGRAIIDYRTSRYDAMLPQSEDRRGEKAKAVAISIEDRRTARWHQTAASLGADHMRYFHGKRLREYSLEDLGRFDVISDVIGGFSYALDLSLFVQKVMELLEVNGSFYSLLQDVHSETGANRPYYAPSPFLTEIRNADGSEVKVCAWLKSIPCVEVTCELKTELAPPIERYRVKKVCEHVAVPRLVPTHFEAGTPPERRFRLSGAAGASRP